MSSLVKFWISSTLLLFVLSVWPFIQLGKNAMPVSEAEFGKEAKLVDYFCLSQTPTGGRTSNPKVWESVLGAEIKLRESAGEAAGDAGLPRKNSEQITALQPGEGLLHTDEKSIHYVLRSAQGKDWYLILTKKNTGRIFTASDNSRNGASPVAMSIGFALLGGGLLTLLARVAFSKSSQVN